MLTRPCLRRFVVGALKTLLRQLGLQRQQGRFARQASGVAGEAAICPQHAVAGHHHTQGVAAHGGGHGAHGTGAGDGLAQRAVAGGVAAGQGQQGTPHGLLKGRAHRQIQRQIKPPALALQVLLQLGCSLQQGGVLRRRFPGGRA